MIKNLIMSIMVMSAANAGTDSITSNLDKIYAGMGYTSVINTDIVINGQLQSDKDAGTIIAGYQISEFVAAEGRYSFVSTTTDSFTFAEVSGNNWGVYIKPQLKIQEAFKIYALLGYGDIGYLEDSAGGQYGLGASYTIQNDLEIFVDWVNGFTGETGSLQDSITKDGSIDSITIGAICHW